MRLMIPEMGHFALILLFCLSILQCVTGYYAVHCQCASAIKAVFRLTWGNSLFVSVSFACLAYSLWANDFSVAYVAQNSNSNLPWMYRVAAIWGAHEGSLLLWIFDLTCLSTVFFISSRHFPIRWRTSVLTILGGNQR